MEQFMPEKIDDGQPPAQRVVYTTAEAAAALGVNEATIYRLIARKKLRTVRALRHKRILKSELERYVGGPIVVPLFERPKPRAKNLHAA
jgi:excisionase family DNA binding protein